MEIIILALCVIAVVAACQSFWSGVFITIIAACLIAIVNEAIDRVK